MWFAIILILFVIVIILSGLNVYLNVNAIVTRKVFHVVICIVSLYNSLLYKENIKITIIPLVFVLSVLFINIFKIMPFIKRKEEAHGDIWLSLIILINSIFVYFNIIDVSIVYLYYLILGFGDGVSGIAPLIFSKRLKIKNGKSVNGSCLFFIFSFLIILTFNKILYNINLYNAIILCFSSTIIELFSNKISDNLLIYINVLILYNVI